MARGQQKLQSQAKAAEKAAKIKKQQGHNANSQKKAAQKALVFVCVVCKVRIHHIVVKFSPPAKSLLLTRRVCLGSQAQMPDPKTYKQHFENKHPKNDMPEELKSVIA